MRYLDERIGIITRELRELAARDRQALTEWEYKKGLYLHPADADGDGTPWRPFAGGKDRWYGTDEHYWFRGTYTVPKEWDGACIYLYIRTEADAADDEWTDGKNPQFLIFVDGEPVQGADMHHRELRLTEKARAGRTYRIELQAYTGIMHSEFGLLADAVRVDTNVMQLYFDLKTPMEAFVYERMPKGRTRSLLVEVLNEGINRIDLREPKSAAFDASVADALAYLRENLYENPEFTGFDEVTATCIGHTHIDVAWWWTVAQTREKTARSFATVLKLMEEYPNYCFMSSQPQLYVFLKERYPELYARVKERVKEGRWIPEGGMWLEADTNLTSGESLVRQFLYGKKFFKEEFGVDSRILWLPDVFGYTGALPQIMKECGIDYFMTTKLAWNQIDKFPCDTFLWKGIDGTGILAHLITTPDVGADVVKSHYTTYNAKLHADAVIGAWDRYQNKDINDNVLICYGHGDGGGGPTREMLENSLRLEKGIKGIPKVVQESPLTWFEELDKKVRHHRRLPVWEGELYFEYHRGTLTSMARNKRGNRKSELAMMDLELLSVLAEKAGVAYPGADLERMWKVILLNQFHDILPGSSIHEVYEVTKKEYETLLAEAAEKRQACMRALAGEGDGVTVFNTAGFARTDLVVLPAGTDGDALADADGNLYPLQEGPDGKTALAAGIPAKGQKTFKTVKAGAGETPFAVAGNVLDTPFYRVELDEKGWFSSLYDKENDREVLKEGGRANWMVMYEDKPMNYDNWDIDMYYTEKSWDADDVQSMEWTAMGPVYAELTVERRISQSRIRQKIRFYAGSRQIRFETWVDWKEHQHLLKVHFPLDIHTDEAAFDIQFGNVTRKIHTNTSWDEARFESCGQKWADLSEGHYGVSLLNDCKYGHSAKDGVLSLTLIKSGILPNPVADQEEHFFTYALYPHAGTWRDAGTVREAVCLNQPLLAVAGGVLGEERSLIAVSRPNVILETVKKAEDGDGIIVRMYESENARTRAHITLGFAASSVEDVNCLEEKKQSVPLAGDGYDVEIKPYEIRTFRIRGVK